MGKTQKNLYDLLKNEIKARLFAWETAKDKKHGTKAFKPYDLINISKAYMYQKEKLYILIKNVKKKVADVLGQIKI